MTATCPPGAATVSLTPDQAAAHHLLCELRTRIATQRLPYQHGVEPRALESLREVFDHARDAMKENPGCSAFARRATDVLNTVLRPITAKWHPALVEGRLASKDGSDELRGDLEEVRTELRAFALELQEMAYGANAVAEDAETPPALEEAELRACLEPLAFGIPLDRADVAADGLSLVTNPTTPGQSRPLDPVALMNASEAADVKERRQNLGRGGVPGKDAVGLALWAWCRCWPSAS